MAKKKPPLPITLLNEEGRDLYAAIKDENPLPCVLISTSQVEQCLATLLHRFFIESSVSDEIFSHNGGILGELFSRSKMAYSLGLIDKMLFANLLRVGQIRNIFAHSHLKLGFDDARIAAFCNELEYPSLRAYRQIATRGSVGDRVLGQVLLDLDKPHGRYKAIVALIATSLVTLATTVERRVPTPTTWVKVARRG